MSVVIKPEPFQLTELELMTNRYADEHVARLEAELHNAKLQRMIADNALKMKYTDGGKYHLLGKIVNGVGQRVLIPPPAPAVTELPAAEAAPAAEPVPVPG